jgi:sigma-54-specific transcriptional regulator
VKLLPLRERRDDILPLAERFIEVYRVKLGLQRASMTPAAVEALLTFDWPGNIRQLENVLHLALIMSRDGLIDRSDLRLPALREGGTDETPDHEPQDRLQMLGEALRHLLRSEREGVYEEVERLLMQAAYEHCAGNQVRTAKRLGISRNVVRAQLKRFGLLGAGA